VVPHCTKIQDFINLCSRKDDFGMDAKRPFFAMVHGKDTHDEYLRAYHER
jgi:hypothetical protein